MPDITIGKPAKTVYGYIAEVRAIDGDYALVRYEDDVYVAYPLASLTPLPDPAEELADAVFDALGLGGRGSYRADIVALFKSHGVK